MNTKLHITTAELNTLEARAEKYESFIKNIENLSERSIKQKSDIIQEVNNTEAELLKITEKVLNNLRSRRKVIEYPNSEKYSLALQQSGLKLIYSPISNVASMQVSITRLENYVDIFSDKKLVDDIKENVWTYDKKEILEKLKCLSTMKDVGLTGSPCGAETSDTIGMIKIIKNHDKVMKNYSDVLKNRKVALEQLKDHFADFLIADRI